MIELNEWPLFIFTSATSTPYLKIASEKNKVTYTLSSGFNTTVKNKLTLESITGWSSI